MRKPYALAGLQALNAGFSILAVLLLAVIVIVPFLAIDRNFTITPGFSLAAATNAWDASLWSALKNSVILSVIASLFAIFMGALLARIIERRPIWIFAIMVAVYAVNPVARALSYFDLFQVYTPIYDWTVALLGRRFATTILLPALILGAHYFPIYLMRNLFVVKQRNVAHDLPPLLETLFDDIPVWVRGLPISFALFFLLTFFDYWVIQVISGNTVLYWTPLFVQKGFQARAVSEAALMIVIGLGATMAAYAGALACSTVVRMAWRQLRPLWFRRMNGPAPIWGILRAICAWIALLFLAWPLLGSLLKLARYLLGGSEIAFINDTGRGLFVMITLGAGVATLSCILGLALSAVFQENPGRRKWWLPALYLLALVPEAAYVLFSLFVTGTGILHASLPWLIALMASFSIPISFFLWESLWGEVERRKLWMLGSAMGRDPVKAIGIALTEWRKQCGIVFVVVFWLTIDNVFITDFAAGPKWKPLSAVVFNATKRGFSEEEFFSSLLGTVTVLAVILGVLWFTRPRSDATLG